MAFLGKIGAGILIILGSLWSGTLGLLNISQPTVSVTTMPVQEENNPIVYMYDSAGNKSGFAKDINHVYFSDPDGTILGVAKPDDASAGEAYGREVDVKTFELTGLHGIYSKDKNYVYFATGMYFTTVAGADPQTFLASSTNFNVSQDKNHIYFYGNIIVGADPATFQVFQNSDFGKDKYSVFLLDYNRSEIVKGASPLSFYVFPPFIYPNTGTTSVIYGKDNSRIYCYSQILAADYSSFEIVSAWSAKDKNNKYSSCDIYDPSNP